MLLSMCFDDDDETAVTALFQVGDQVLQLKQKPNEGRVYDKDKEEKQEYAMAHPEEDFHPSSASGQYDSAFPNVGLVVWQSGFVLGEYLLRTKPLGSWNKPLRVLELGCGTGQLGIVLALAGADVTLTDLEHITPLTQVNIDLNSARCAVQPTVMPYMWGTDIALLQAVGGKQWQQQQEVSGHSSIQQQQEPVLQQQQQQGPLQQQPWDLIVAADVLYEPQHYDELLQSLTQLCPMPSVARDNTSNGADDPQLNAAVGALHISQEEQQSHEEIEQLPLNSNMLSPPIYICYRVRRYGEHGFENKAIKCGFEVSAVPIDDLHADYRCGGYRLIRLDRKH